MADESGEFVTGGVPLRWERTGSTVRVMGAKVELTEFITQRLDEWEAVARTDPDADGADWHDDIGPQWHTAMCGLRMGEYMERCRCDVRARVLAQVEAMRRIVANAERAREAMGSAPLTEQLAASDGPAAAYWRGQDFALRALASIWRDHEQYDPAWAD